MVIEHRLFYCLSINSLVAIFYTLATNSLVANFPCVSQTKLAGCNDKHNYSYHRYKILLQRLLSELKR